MSKVAFRVTFPVIHPVTAAHTWHHAAVVADDLDLPDEEIFRIVRDTIALERGGSIGAILQIAETLRGKTGGMSVLIVWEPVNTSDLPVEVDVVVDVNYDEGKVSVNRNEFSFDSIERSYHDGIDWKDEFIQCLSQRS